MSEKLTAQELQDEFEDVQDVGSCYDEDEIRPNDYYNAFLGPPGNKR